MSVWQRAATSSPRACTPALSTLNGTSCTSKQLSVFLYLSGPHTINSIGQWLPPFLKVCSHLHAAMQITSLSFSLLFIKARAPPHARMQAWSLPFLSHAQDRQRTTAVNSFNWFQLAATAFSSLSSASCWAAHWI
jgi:hypothetical protein